MLLKSRGYQVCQRALSAICFKVSICFARASRSFGDNCEVVFGASDTAKNTQKLRPHIAAEILIFNGGQNDRNIKTLAAFANPIVLLISSWRSMEATPKVICGCWSIKMTVEFSGVSKLWMVVAERSSRLWFRHGFSLQDNAKFHHLSSAS